MSEDDEGVHITEGLVESLVALALIVLIVSGSWSIFGTIGAIAPMFRPGFIVGQSLMPIVGNAIQYTPTGTPGWYAVSNAYLVVQIQVNQQDSMWLTKLNTSYLQSIQNSLLAGTPYTNIQLTNPIEIDIAPLTPSISWAMTTIPNLMVCPSATGVTNPGSYVSSVSFNFVGVPSYTTPTVTTNPIFATYMKMSGLVSAALSLPFQVTVKTAGATTATGSPLFTPLLSQAIAAGTNAPNSWSIPVTTSSGSGTLIINGLGVLGSYNLLPSNIGNYIFFPGAITGDQVTDGNGNPYLIYGGTSSVEPLLSNYGSYWFGGSSGSVVTTGAGYTASAANPMPAGYPFEPLGTCPGWRRQTLTGNVANLWPGLTLSSTTCYYYYPSQPSLGVDQGYGYSRNNTWTWGLGNYETITSDYDFRPGQCFYNWMKFKSGGTLYQQQTPPYFGGNLLNWWINNPKSPSPTFVANLPQTMYTNLITLEIPTTLGNLLVYQNPGTATTFSITSPTNGFNLGTLLPGQSFSLTVTVQNTGSVNSGTALVVCKSLNPAVTVYGSPGSTASLAPGASGTIGFTLWNSGVSTQITGNVVELDLYASGGQTMLQSVTLIGTLVVPTSIMYIASIQLVPSNVPPNGMSTAKIFVMNQGGGLSNTATIQVTTTGPFVVSPASGTFTATPGQQTEWDTTVSAQGSQGSGTMTVNLLVNNNVVSTQTIALTIGGGFIPQTYYMFFLFLAIVGILLLIVGAYLWTVYDLFFLLLTGIGLTILSACGFIFGNTLINGINQIIYNFNMLSTTWSVTLYAPIFYGMTMWMLITMAIVAAVATILFLWWWRSQE